jgi:hypothetical protein
LACVGKYPTLDSLPLYPRKNQMAQWLVKAGVDSTTPRESNLLKHFCFTKLLVTKPMLPKLLDLLQFCHSTDHMSNQWYYKLQKTIQNHFRTEGSCLFYNDSKEILSGEMEFEINFNLAGMMQQLDLL